MLDKLTRRFVLKGAGSVAIGAFTGGAAHGGVSASVGYRLTPRIQTALTALMRLHDQFEFNPAAVTSDTFGEAVTNLVGRVEHALTFLKRTDADKLLAAMKQYDVRQEARFVANLHNTGGMEAALALGKEEDAVIPWNLSSDIEMLSSLIPARAEEYDSGSSPAALAPRLKRLLEFARDAGNADAAKVAQRLLGERLKYSRMNLGAPPDLNARFFNEVSKKLEKIAPQAKPEIREITAIRRDVLDEEYGHTNWTGKAQGRLPPRKNDREI